MSHALTLDSVKPLPLIFSFAPIARSDATGLILGSMPGEASLHAAQYYAHPRNLFWRIMSSLVPFELQMPYEQRIQALVDAKIALWDVLQSCTRTGSLDVSIDKSSRIPNDFQTFFLRHPHITHVYFNGALAEKFYRQLVLPYLSNRSLIYTRLPSTSPAHAALSFEAKLEAWRVIEQAA